MDSYRLKPLLHASYRQSPAADLLNSRDESLLALFEFGQAPTPEISDPRHVRVGLELMGDSPACEAWVTRGPVSQGHWQDIHFSTGSSITFGQLALDENRFGSIGETTRHAYQQIIEFIGEHRHPWLWKIWHYIPDINRGDGDQERYRQFCMGRAAALGDDLSAMPAMPAATAIGTSIPGNVLQIYFLCGPRPGMHVENPRQLEPAQYPRQYGKKSPLFSRGTIISDNGDHQLLISGTASILGHKTHHHDDVEAQIHETLSNVEALVSESRRHYGEADAGAASFNGLLKVYVRERDDLELIRAAVMQRMGDKTPAVYLLGDICRLDLLTEVEGINT